MVTLTHAHLYYFYTKISVHAGFLNLGKASKKRGLSPFKFSVALLEQWQMPKYLLFIVSIRVMFPSVLIRAGADK